MFHTQHEKRPPSERLAAGLGLGLGLAGLAGAGSGHAAGSGAGAVVGTTSSAGHAMPTAVAAAQTGGGGGGGGLHALTTAGTRPSTLRRTRGSASTTDVPASMEELACFDVYPQGPHPSEDVLDSSTVKRGYIHIPDVQNEMLSAYDLVHDRLRESTALQELSAFLETVPAPPPPPPRPSSAASSATTSYESYGLHAPDGSGRSGAAAAVSGAAAHVHPDVPREVAVMPVVPLRIDATPEQHAAWIDGLEGPVRDGLAALRAHCAALPSHVSWADLLPWLSRHRPPFVTAVALLRAVGAAAATADAADGTWGPAVGHDSDAATLNATACLTAWLSAEFHVFLDSHRRAPAAATAAAAASKKAAPVPVPPAAVPADSVARWKYAIGLVTWLCHEGLLHTAHLADWSLAVLESSHAVRAVGAMLSVVCLLMADYVQCRVWSRRLALVLLARMTAFEAQAAAATPVQWDLLTKLANHLAMLAVRLVLAVPDVFVSARLWQAYHTTWTRLLVLQPPPRHAAACRATFALIDRRVRHLLLLPLPPRGVPPGTVPPPAHPRRATDDRHATAAIEASFCSPPPHRPAALIALKVLDQLEALSRNSAVPLSQLTLPSSLFTAPHVTADVPETPVTVTIDGLLPAPSPTAVEPAAAPSRPRPAHGHSAAPSTSTTAPSASAAAVTTPTVGAWMRHAAYLYVHGVAMAVQRAASEVDAAAPVASAPMVPAPTAPVQGLSPARRRPSAVDSARAAPVSQALLSELVTSVLAWSHTAHQLGHRTLFAVTLIEALAEQHPSFHAESALMQHFGAILFGPALAPRDRRMHELVWLAHHLLNRKLMRDHALQHRAISRGHNTKPNFVAFIRELPYKPFMSQQLYRTRLIGAHGYSHTDDAHQYESFRQHIVQDSVLSDVFLSPDEVDDAADRPAYIVDNVGMEAVEPTLELFDALPIYWQQRAVAWLAKSMLAFVVREMEIGLANWRTATTPGVSLLNSQQSYAFLTLLTRIPEPVMVVRHVLWLLRKSQNPRIWHQCIAVLHAHDAVWVVTGRVGEVLKACYARHTELRTRRMMSEPLLMYTAHLHRMVQGVRGADAAVPAVASAVPSKLSGAALSAPASFRHEAALLAKDALFFQRRFAQATFLPPLYAGWQAFQQQVRKDLAEARPQTADVLALAQSVTYAVSGRPDRIHVLMGEMFHHLTEVAATAARPPSASPAPAPSVPPVVAQRLRLCVDVLTHLHRSSGAVTEALLGLCHEVYVSSWRQAAAMVPPATTGSGTSGFSGGGFSKRASTTGGDGGAADGNGAAAAPLALSLCAQTALGAPPALRIAFWVAMVGSCILTPSRLVTYVIHPFLGFLSPVFRQHADAARAAASSSSSSSSSSSAASLVPVRPTMIASVRELLLLTRIVLYEGVNANAPAPAPASPAAAGAPAQAAAPSPSPSSMNMMSPGAMPRLSNPLVPVDVEASLRAQRAQSPDLAWSVYRALHRGMAMAAAVHDAAGLTPTAHGPSLAVWEPVLAELRAHRRLALQCGWLHAATVATLGPLLTTTLMPFVETALQSAAATTPSFLAHLPAPVAGSSAAAPSSAAADGRRKRSYDASMDLDGDLTPAAALDLATGPGDAHRVDDTALEATAHLIARLGPLLPRRYKPRMHHPHGDTERVPRDEVATRTAAAELVDAIACVYLAGVGAIEPTALPPPPLPTSPPAAAAAFYSILMRAAWSILAADGAAADAASDPPQASPPGGASHRAQVTTAATAVRLVLAATAFRTALFGADAMPDISVLSGCLVDAWRASIVNGSRPAAPYDPQADMFLMLIYEIQCADLVRDTMEALFAQTSHRVWTLLQPLPASRLPSGADDVDAPLVVAAPYAGMHPHALARLVQLCRLYCPSRLLASLCENVARLADLLEPPRGMLPPVGHETASPIAACCAVHRTPRFVASRWVAQQVTLLCALAPHVLRRGPNYILPVLQNLLALVTRIPTVEADADADARASTTSDAGDHDMTRVDPPPVCVVCTALRDRHTSLRRQAAEDTTMADFPMARDSFDNAMDADGAEGADGAGADPEGPLLAAIDLTAWLIDAMPASHEPAVAGLLRQIEPQRLAALAADRPLPSADLAPHEATYGVGDDAGPRERAARLRSLLPPARLASLLDVLTLPPLPPTLASASSTASLAAGAAAADAPSHAPNGAATKASNPPASRPVLTDHALAAAHLLPLHGTGPLRLAEVSVMARPGAGGGLGGATAPTTPQTVSLGSVMAAAAAGASGRLRAPSPAPLARYALQAIPPPPPPPSVAPVPGDHAFPTAAATAAAAAAASHPGPPPARSALSSPIAAAGPGPASATLTALATARARAAAVANPWLQLECLTAAPVAVPPAADPGLPASATGADGAEAAAGDLASTTTTTTTTTTTIATAAPAVSLATAAAPTPAASAPPAVTTWPAPVVAGDAQVNYLVSFFI
ncbi:hypothetical protein CXG81DRAFT_23544 [Caulochytrium protostelioides]|uniref:Uncharacterized protein n=1 Tax=Caulochytrium protostelioides TaxID=1555241 RepID=A0A4P9XF71_9FUNG|nr:hypothetical protein CXG81DRAFT_23544 [Caulochytrium protostelioides]|eukprot:RKP03851.1 hypothetical protein CXG81DRAFT_23544 [Caulochytrium protostelioides]